MQKQKEHHFSRRELGLGWSACSSLGDSGSGADFPAKLHPNTALR
ncbi:hypothetical protein TIFTF001_031187, partial [Ficus carica]